MKQLQYVVNYKISKGNIKQAVVAAKSIIDDDKPKLFTNQPAGSITALRKIIILSEADFTKLKTQTNPHVWVKKEFKVDPKTGEENRISGVPKKRIMTGKTKEDLNISQFKLYAVNFKCKIEWYTQREFYIKVRCRDAQKWVEEQLERPPQEKSFEILQGFLEVAVDKATQLVQNFKKVIAGESIITHVISWTDKWHVPPTATTELQSLSQGVSVQERDEDEKQYQADCLLNDADITGDGCQPAAIKTVRISTEAQKDTTQHLHIVPLWPPTFETPKSVILFSQDKIQS